MNLKMDLITLVIFCSQRGGTTYNSFFEKKEEKLLRPIDIQLIPQLLVNLRSIPNEFYNSITQIGHAVFGDDSLRK